MRPSSVALHTGYGRGAGAAGCIRGAADVVSPSLMAGNWKKRKKKKEKWTYLIGLVNILEAVEG